MIRPIDIRLNAAHPDLPLAEAVTYTGAPSTVLIRGVPGNCGRWAITAVFVAATFPDGSTTTRTAVQSANGVWVATLPVTATSGRTAHGLRILADGADENGEAVGGYVLGVADFAVASLDVTPAPQPGGIAYALRYFDTLPDPAKKGDVIRVNGDLKFYNGTAWQPFTDLSDYYTAEQVDEAIDRVAAYYLFAKYYPDGSVTSAAEFTQGIKYDTPDTTSRTITVKTFCFTGDSANDNSDLSGRVVIPPFVDEQGNPYISDDGTRYKVVGVSGMSGPYGYNSNQIAVVAPNTVTGIGERAFNACASLTSVSLPAATSINDYAFAECYALASVDFGDTPRSSVPSLGTDAFSGVPTSCKIIVPYTQYDAWKAATGWSSLPQEFVRHAEKADKPATFTTGNLAKFDANGNPVDSGKKPSDFQSALTAQQLANIAAVSDALAFDATRSYAEGDPVVYNGTLYTFTAAHTGAWTGSDVEAVNIIARLAGKLDKSGGTMTGPLQIGDNSAENIILNPSNATITTEYIKNNYSSNNCFVPNGPGTLALAAPSVASAGNLAALDAQGNPTDAGWTAGDLARDSLVAKTITNGAVTLDDRAINAVAVSSSLASLTVNFPTATSGRVRDFGLRLTVASGITTAPELALPQGVVCENADGEAPEIGSDGAATILYFTETASGVFLVKGEVVTAIS